MANQQLLSLFAPDWQAIGSETRRKRALDFLEAASSDYGTVVAITLDEHRFGRLWTLCLEVSEHSFVEQMCFAENPNPKYYGPGIPRYAQRYDHHWSLTVRGSFTKQFVESLHRAGAWDAQVEPAYVEPYLDGGTVEVIAKHPRYGPCVAHTFTGAVYATGTKGIDIEIAAHRMCHRSITSFRLGAWIGWLYSVVT